MALLARRVARVHKIVGLVAGLLLLSWTASGLFFSLYPIETIRGDPWRPDIDHGALSDMQIAVSAEDILARTPGTVSHMRLKPFLGAPVWVVEAGETRLMIDAVSGAVRSPLPETDIDALMAAFDTAPDGLGTFTVRYLIHENPQREYGGPLPAWVIEYEPGKQRIYVDAVSGEVRAVRTTKWRIFDVLWRFHILDVTGDDRFDSWWLKLAAFLGLTMALSGLVLLIDRWRKRRFFS